MLNTPGTPASSSPGPSTSTSMTATPSAGGHHRLMLNNMGTPASSSRLQLKQTPIDVWSLREQLGLASAVLRSGDQNWVSVSRQMKPFSEEGRPNDWFSQKNCALQYNLLLEKVDTPRRKRSDKSEVTETPGEAIVRLLKAERLKELKSIIEKQASQIKRYEEEVQLLKDPSTSEEKVAEIEAAADEEDRQDDERNKAHKEWLAEREKKKLAIQAALKAHSAKIPLKGAAAAAASAAQASIARRLSAQSERNSFSDVDSPAGPASQNSEMTKQEIEVSALSSNAETTSPLLSSLLKSPTATTTTSMPLSQNVPPVPDVDADAEVKNVDQKDDVDEPMEVNDDSIAANTNDDVNDAGEENEQKSEENVEELLAAAVDQVAEKMPDIINILAGVENGDANIDAANEVDEKTPAVESNIVVIQNGVDQVAEVPPNDAGVNVDDIKQEVSESSADETNHEDLANNSCDVEKSEASNDQADLAVVNIKTEDEGQIDDKTIADEDKPLTSDLKRVPKLASASKSGRRSRKQSDVNADEDSSEARRETRSKKTSERSDECSGPAGSGNLEMASEESPLPPPSVGARETRRSAAKKAPTNDAVDGNDSLKDDKEELTPLNVAENRRVSRLKEKESSVSRKSRRGSGATTASRSSSPVVSGDESESDPLMPRSSRTRQKSGKAATTTSTAATTVTPEASNAADETSRPVTPDTTASAAVTPTPTFSNELPPSSSSSSRDAEEEWIKLASNILVDVTSHKSFDSFRNVENGNVAGVALHPCSVSSLKKGLDEGSIKSVQEFYADFLLMLVNGVMEFSSGSEPHQSAVSLFSEFNDTLQDVLMPLEPVKSVPSTPIKTSTTPTPSSPTKPTSKAIDGVDAKKIDLKRKRGSTSTSMSATTPASSTATTEESPLNKKRKRI